MSRISHAKAVDEIFDAMGPYYQPPQESIPVLARDLRVGDILAFCQERILKIGREGEWINAHTEGGKDIDWEHCMLILIVPPSYNECKERGLL